MHAGHNPETRRGVVVSDLHLFARRSQAPHCIKSLHGPLTSATELVLNGDIVDFRWSTLRGVDATVAAAVNWLRELLSSFPQCQIHYVLGNHDCLSLFSERLAALASNQPRLQFHPYSVRLGSAIFLHGDCASGHVDPAGLQRYRNTWDNPRQSGALRTRAYIMADRLGITRFTHARSFPRRRTVERIVRYLDRTCPDWRRGIRDCYFGHTHLPFSNYHYNGVAFHNTGSAIRGMGFNPLVFPVMAESGASSLTSHRHGRAG